MNPEKIVLDYIIKFKTTNGYAPVTEEIMKGVNTNSRSWVTEMLERLEENGYITRNENKPRTINIIKFE